MRGWADGGTAHPEADRLLVFHWQDRVGWPVPPGSLPRPGEPAERFSSGERPSCLGAETDCGHALQMEERILLT